MSDPTAPQDNPQPIRLQDDAVAFMGQAFKVVGHDAVDLHDLVTEYTIPKPNDLADLREMIRISLAQPKGTLDPYDIKTWLILQSIDEIAANNPDALEIGKDRDGDVISVRLADGVDVNSLQVCGEPLIPQPILGDPFNPETGVFKDNIRAEGADRKALRESMEQFGWRKGNPVVKDENNVTIVGRGREEIAAELGIEPEVEIRFYGKGDAADVKRIEDAMLSNAQTGFSPADRKRIALALLGKPGYDMEKIAAKLHVATRTIYRDLDGLTNVKRDPSKGGRPKGSGKKKTPKAGTTEGVTTETPPPVDEHTLPLEAHEMAAEAPTPEPGASGLLAGASGNGDTAPAPRGRTGLMPQLDRWVEFGHQLVKSLEDVGPVDNPESAARLSEAADQLLELAERLTNLCAVNAGR